MDLDYNENYDAGDFFDMGRFDVRCDPILYGGGRITLDYRIYFKFNSEDLSRILSFIQENYRQAYDQVLAGVFFRY